jgi:hypothetical protein
VAFGFIGLLALYGFHTARADQPLLGPTFLEEDPNRTIG